MEIGAQAETPGVICEHKVGILCKLPKGFNHD